MGINMIKKCEITDLDKITDMAFRLNNIPESNSAYCFKGYEAIRDDFEQMLKDKDNFILGYLDEEGLGGVCGFFTDRKKKTADLVGPFVEREEFIDIASEMLQFAGKKLPWNNRYNFFFNKKNSRYLEFMEVVHAGYQCDEYSLLLTRSNYRKLKPDKKAEELPFIYADKVKRMHDVNFKDSYITGAEITGPALNGRKVFCIVHKEELAGYGTYRLWATPDRASVEVLYVEPEYRNQGCEQALLTGMIESIYENERIEYIGMVIETDDRYFIEICSQAGFEIDAENCSYVLKRGVLYDKTGI